MSYELWDTDSGNCIWEGEDRDSAVECVRSIVEAYGELDGLSLGEEPYGRIWEGEDLVELIK